MNAKLHAVTGASGCLIAFFMSAGLVSDYTGAATVLRKPQFLRLRNWPCSRQPAIRSDPDNSAPMMSLTKYKTHRMTAFNLGKMTCAASSFSLCP